LSRQDEPRPPPHEVNRNSDDKNRNSWSGGERLVAINAPCASAKAKTRLWLLTDRLLFVGNSQSISRGNLQTDEFWSVGSESEAALCLLRRLCSPVSIGGWREAGVFVAQSLSGRNRCFAPFDDSCPPIYSIYTEVTSYSLSVCH